MPASIPRRSRMPAIDEERPPAELLGRIAAAERNLDALRQGLADWHRQREAIPERDPAAAEVADAPGRRPFTTVSGAEIDPLYTPLDRSGGGGPEEARFHDARLGFPGA